MFAWTVLIFENRTDQEDNNVALMQWGKPWRERRRVLENGMRSATVLKYQHVQKEKLAIALRRLAHDPSEFNTHLKE